MIAVAAMMAVMIAEVINGKIKAAQLQMRNDGRHKPAVPQPFGRRGYITISAGRLNASVAQLVGLARKDNDTDVLLPVRIRPDTSEEMRWTNICNPDCTTATAWM